MIQKLAAAADSTRRALDFAEDYRRKQANDQLDTLLNQVDATRNFLDTPAMEIEEKYDVVISARLDKVEEMTEIAIDTSLQFDR